MDTVQIKEEYAKLYGGASMEKEIADDVSGDYGRLLLRLLVDASKRTYETAEPEPEHVMETVEEPLIEETPTLRDAASFSPNADCDQLRKAMKGLWTYICLI